MTEEIDHIEVDRDQVPKGQCIIESVSGEKWVVLNSYSHLGEPYVLAIPVPRELKTYRIVER